MHTSERIIGTRGQAAKTEQRQKKKKKYSQSELVIMFWFVTRFMIASDGQPV
jgi:hypothetical protein